MSNTAAYVGIHVFIPENCHSAEQKEELILNALSDSCEISIPEEKVINEMNAMMLELYQQMHYEALCTGQCHYHMAEDMEARRSDIQKAARRQVKLELILQDIIKKENLKVSAEELKKEAAAMAARQGTTIEMVKNFFGDGFEMLRRDLLLRKAIDYVCSAAVIEQTAPSAPSTAPQQAAGH